MHRNTHTHKTTQYNIKSRNKQNSIKVKIFHSANETVNNEKKACGMGEDLETVDLMESVPTLSAAASQIKPAKHCINCLFLCFYSFLFLLPPSLLLSFPFSLPSPSFLPSFLCAKGGTQSLLYATKYSATELQPSIFFQKTMPVDKNI